MHLTTPRSFSACRHAPSTPTKAASSSSPSAAIVYLASAASSSRSSFSQSEKALRSSRSWRISLTRGAKSRA